MVPNTKLTLKSLSYALGLTTNKNYQKNVIMDAFLSFDFYSMHLDLRASRSSFLYATIVYGEKRVFKNVCSAIIRLHQG